MNRWARPVQILLTAVAVVTMLSWGAYATLWAFPNDQGSIIQAILNGEYQWGWYRGVTPGANGTIIPPGSQAQFILDYRTQSQGGGSGGGSLPPSGLGFVVGPFLWALPTPSLTSFAKNYAIFTLSFSSRFGSGNFSLWFTGPLGNITSSFDTSKYGGLQIIPYESFNTAILESSAAGNYTLHYVNRNTSANVTGQVVVGPSTVTFTRPYLYVGLTTIAVAAALSIATGLSLRTKAQSSVK
jgi:hypothetical protein